MEEREANLTRAVRWAAKLHRGQNRDGAAPLPYITHPIDVMNRLRYVADVQDLEVLCAAVLHDVVEECQVDLGEIELRFGARVRGLVQELTRTEPDADAIAGLDEGQVWDLRNRMLLEEIEHMSSEAQLVKLADRASNLQAALATRTGEKRARYVLQSGMILERIPRRVCPALWDSIQAMLNGQSGISR